MTTQIFRIVADILDTLLPMFKTYLLIKKELPSSQRRVSYSYLELQRKLPCHDDFLESFMSLIASLGFVMQFSLVNPLLPLLQLLWSCWKIRLLAVKICFLRRRPEGLSSSGIGELADRIRELTWLCLFVLVVLRVQSPVIPLTSKWEGEYKFELAALLLFAVFPTRFILKYAFPGTGHVHSMIEYENKTVLPKVFTKQGSLADVKLNVPSTKLPNMRLDAEGDLANGDHFRFETEPQFPPEEHGTSDDNNEKKLREELADSERKLFQAMAQKTALETHVAATSSGQR